MPDDMGNMWVNVKDYYSLKFFKIRLSACLVVYPWDFNLWRFLTTWRGQSHGHILPCRATVRKHQFWSGDRRSIKDTENIDNTIDPVMNGCQKDKYRIFLTNIHLGN